MCVCVCVLHACSQPPHHRSASANIVMFSNKTDCSCHHPFIHTSYTCTRRGRSRPPAPTSPASFSRRQSRRTSNGDLQRRTGTRTNGDDLSSAKEEKNASRIKQRSYLPQHDKNKVTMTFDDKGLGVFKTSTDAYGA